MLEKLKQVASKLKTEFAFYRRLQQHPETPKLAKGMLWLAIAYIAMPFDLIPDFIPILGQLDEVVIIPLLLYSALKLTPQHVVAYCKEKVE